MAKTMVQDTDVASLYVHIDRSEGNILEDQWSRQYGARENDTPEDRLLFAVLEEALRELIVISAMKNPKWQQSLRLREARRWFSDKLNHDIFSFDFIWQRFFSTWSINTARASLLTHPEIVASKLAKYKNVKAAKSAEKKKKRDEE